MQKNITASYGQSVDFSTEKSMSKKNIFIKLHTSFREEQLKELKGAPLSVFLALILHMDDDWETFVSNYTISKETGYSVRTVQKAKRNLEEWGYLKSKKEKVTEELIMKRYPNDEKKQEKLREKIGAYTSSTYRLFPEQDQSIGGGEPEGAREQNSPNPPGEKSSSRGDSQDNNDNQNIPENKPVDNSGVGEKSSARKKVHPKKNQSLNKSNPHVYIINNLKKKKYKKKKQNLDKIFSEMLDHIKTEIPKASFNTWFTSLYPHELDTENNILTMKAENSFISRWLEREYTDLITSCLYTMTGEVININIKPDKNIN